MTSMIQYNLNYIYSHLRREDILRISLRSTGDVVLNTNLSWGEIKSFYISSKNVLEYWPQKWNVSFP